MGKRSIREDCRGTRELHYKNMFHHENLQNYHGTKPPPAKLLKLNCQDIPRTQ